jgi:hypothetical protein
VIVETSIVGKGLLPRLDIMRSTDSHGGCRGIHGPDETRRTV